MKKQAFRPTLPPVVRDSNSILNKARDLYGYDKPGASYHMHTEPALTPTQLAKVPHLEWIPAHIQDLYCWRNGFTLLWEADKQHAPLLRGRILLKPLQIMLGDWEGEMYFSNHLTSKNAHMQNFKVVDACTDEAVVGLFHTEARDPELHYYDLEDTTPLRVDFAGYLTLLTHTLGCHGWQALLLELDAPTPETRPFLPTDAAAQEALRKLQAAVPDFNLDAFVACYDQVRLQPSSAS